MKIPLRNRIRSWIGAPLRRRMLAARDRFLHAARHDCRRIQADVRDSLLRLNADSRFSSERGLTGGLSLNEFRKRIGVSDYETVRPYVDQMQTGNHQALLGSANELLMYALTSGTTSDPKLIPVTRPFLQAYRKGWQHWGISMYADHPALKTLKVVQISSNHDRYRTADGIPCGNISGLTTSMQNRIVQKMYVVPPAAAKIENADDKQYVVLRFALAEELAGMFVTANPGTLVQLCRQADRWQEGLVRDIHDGTLSRPELPADVARLLQRRINADPARARLLADMFEQHGTIQPATCWPHINALGVWTGGSAGAYRSELKTLFGDLPMRDHGLHASEGRMTIPFADETAAGILDIESHYFEFIPVAEAESSQPTVLEAHELADGQDYFILLTTSSGLWRYNIRDVVRCTGFFGSTPQLEFRHKGSHISSITGEKITESQVVEAVRIACDGRLPASFTLTPCWGKPPGYRLIVEGSDLAASSDLAAKFDQCLRQKNCEYDEKRETGRLAEVRCEARSSAAWQSFRRNRIQSTGGSSEQYKHPCLLPDPKFEGLFDRLIDSNDENSRVA